MGKYRWDICESITSRQRAERRVDIKGSENREMDMDGFVMMIIKVKL